MGDIDVGSDGATVASLLVSSFSSERSHERSFFGGAQLCLSFLRFSYTSTCSQRSACGGKSAVRPTLCLSHRCGSKELVFRHCRPQCASCFRPFAERENNDERDGIKHNCLVEHLIIELEGFNHSPAASPESRDRSPCAASPSYHSLRFDHFKYLTIFVKESFSSGVLSGLTNVLDEFRSSRGERIRWRTFQWRTLSRTDVRWELPEGNESAQVGSSITSFPKSFWAQSHFQYLRRIVIDDPITVNVSLSALTPCSLLKEVSLHTYGLGPRLEQSDYPLGSLPYLESLAIESRQDVYSGPNVSPWGPVPPSLKRLSLRNSSAHLVCHDTTAFPPLHDQRMALMQLLCPCWIGLTDLDLAFSSFDPQQVIDFSSCLSSLRRLNAPYSRGIELQWTTSSTANHYPLQSLNLRRTLTLFHPANRPEGSWQGYFFNDVVPHLTHLRRLELAENGEIIGRNASGAVYIGCTLAESCGALSHLDLSRTHVTQDDLEGLQSAPSLQSLMLEGCRNLSDVSWLSTSLTLCRLYLDESPIDTRGIQGLERIPTLTYLSLVGTRVQAVHALSSSSSLTHLDLRQTDVDNAGLQHLGRLPNLRILLIGGGDRVTITSLFFLKDSQTLEILEVQHADLRRSADIRGREAVTIGLETIPTLKEVTFVSTLLPVGIQSSEVHPTAQVSGCL